MLSFPKLLGWLLGSILASGNPLLHLYKPSKSLQDLAYHLIVSIITVQTLGSDTVDIRSTVVSVKTGEMDEMRQERWGNATGILGESSLATEFLLSP